jgi:DNA (cytosine-5)-methyltransferase 1
VERRVCELFAGVGGFRAGLEPVGWEVVWSNQWEPGRRVQYASDCYVSHFGPGGHSNEDITKVEARSVPDHDFLVGGFPCQDYSVATANARGISGKKGVLWWDLRRIIASKRPPYLLLENVDRLLKSPSTQRGRDFGIMLWCLNSLGYSVEWRTINAADYGAPQKRRRIFIFAAHKGSAFGSAMATESDVSAWIHSEGFFAIPFPVMHPSQRVLAPEPPHVTLPRSVLHVSRSFVFPFENSGLMSRRRVWTYRMEPIREPPVTLGSILEGHAPEAYFVPPSLVKRWVYLKGAKAEKRRADTGYEYHYAEGPLPFPDPLNRPGRTMLTDEGGVSPSRFKHIVMDPIRHRLRVLTPVEAERMNQFPDNWTATGMPERMRYFCMGNALVVGLIRRMGMRLDSLARPQELERPRPRIANREGHGPSVTAR